MINKYSCYKNVTANSHKSFWMCQFYKGKQFANKCKWFWARSSILDSKRTCRSPAEKKLDEVGASTPWNAIQLLHLHLYNTTVIHKLYNADCEGKSNLVTSYLQGVFGGEMYTTLVLFSNEACVHLSGYMDSQNNSYEFAENWIM